MIYKRSLTSELLVFFICLSLFSLGLQTQEIISFEARFYVFAKEMWRHGFSFFPTAYGQPYPDYPVTSTWLIYLVASFLGGLNKFSAVLPSAIAAGLTAVMTYKIAALHQARWGWLAVAMLVFTNTFLMEARTISPDQFICFVTVSSFYAVYAAKLLKQTHRLWYLPVLFIFGFLVRGPIGFIIPTGVACFTVLLDKDYKKFLIIGLSASILLLILSGFYFGLAYHVGGKTFMLDVWRMEVAGRLQDASLPFYFYFQESFGAYALSFPLAVLLMLSLNKKLFSNSLAIELGLIRKLSVWVLLIMLGLSIPAGKKVRYILAISPALALMASYYWQHAEKYAIFGSFKKLLSLLFISLPILSVITLYSVPALTPFHAAKLIYVFVILQIIALYAGVKNNSDILLLVGVSTFVSLYLSVIEPINLLLNETRAFVLRVEKARLAQERQIIFYHEYPDGLPIKYWVYMETESLPIFISDHKGLMQGHDDDFIIITEDNWYKFSVAVKNQFIKIDQGKIGHTPVFVIKVRKLRFQ